MSLEDLFDIFEAGKRSGRLNLVANDNCCVVIVIEGQPVEARLFSGVPRLVTAVNTSAILQICLWDDARFRFVHDTSVVGRTRYIYARFGEIQNRARQQPAPSKRALKPNERLIPDQSPIVDGQNITMSRDAWRLVSSLCRKMRIAEAAVTVGLGLPQALSAAEELAARGLLLYEDPHDDAHRPDLLTNSRPPIERCTPLLQAAPRPAAIVRRGTANSTLVQAIISRVRSL